MQHEIVSSTGSRHMSEWQLVVLLALLMALQALAIDTMLPGLAAMAQDLGAGDGNSRQLVIAVYLFCNGIGALFPGALADRFGRRPVLLTALALYVLISAACALVTSFTALLALRAMQGILTAGVTVLPATIIRDRFSGDRMARLSSMIGIVFMIVPILAPGLGQMVLLFAGWRAIFVLLAVLSGTAGVWAFHSLPETMDPENRQELQPLRILRNMVSGVTKREAVGYTIGNALILGAIFGYVNSAQQLLGEHFALGAKLPLAFATTAAMIALSSFVNSRIVERFGARRVSHTALAGFILIGAAQVAASHLPHQPLWVFLPLLALNMGMLGFLGANFTSLAMVPFARTAGSASSSQTFLRMVMGAAIGGFIGSAYDGTARPLALGFLICALIALGLVLFSERGRLFQPRETTPQPLTA